MKPAVEMSIEMALHYMTYERDLEYIKHRFFCNPDETANTIAVHAMKKQIPRKPKLSETQDIRYIASYICPACVDGFTGTGVADYCYHCGQALDWSDYCDNKI